MHHTLMGFDPPFAEGVKFTEWKTEPYWTKPPWLEWYTSFGTSKCDGNKLIFSHTQPTLQIITICSIKKRVINIFGFQVSIHYNFWQKIIITWFSILKYVLHWRIRKGETRRGPNSQNNLYKFLDLILLLMLHKTQ